jgi:hypothetical protein
MKRLLVFTITVLISLNVCAQNQWELQKEEGLFKVYTRTKQGSQLKESKVTGTMKGTLSSAVALFQDADNFVNFMPDCQESKRLKLVGDTFQVHYVLTGAPWPVSSRDGVYQFNYHYNADSNYVLITIKTLPEYLESIEDVVRIQKCEGYWKFTDKKDGYMQVEYNIFADPEGSIPAWLANSTAVDMPLETVMNAQKRVQLDKYQGKEVIFIK